MSAHTSGRSLSQVGCFIFWQIQYFLIYFASDSQRTWHEVGMQLIWLEQGAVWKGAKIITSIKFSPRQTRIFLNKTWYNRCDLIKENNYWMWNFEVVDELWQSVNYKGGHLDIWAGFYVFFLIPKEHTPKSAKTTSKQTNKKQRKPL